MRTFLVTCESLTRASCYSDFCAHQEIVLKRSNYVLLLILAFFPVSSALAQRDAWIRHSSEPIALSSGSRVEFVTMASEAVGRRGLL